MAWIERQLLIAVPKLHDANFFHGVVLMVRHNAQGAFGLTLNRPGSISTSEIWSQISDGPCHWNQPLFVGGPVEGPLMVLHDQPDAGEAQAAADVYFTVDPDHLERLFGNPQAKAQFYVGYCGWGPGQLESEMAAGAWQTAPVASKYVFEADGDLWARVTHDIGAESLRKTLNIKIIPPDARCN